MTKRVVSLLLMLVASAPALGADAAWDCDNLDPEKMDSVGWKAALSGPDTGGSQYFICHAPQPHLDGRSRWTIALAIPRPGTAQSQSQTQTPSRVQLRSSMVGTALATGVIRLPARVGHAQ